uniref:Capsid protein n=1 Tax=viral metagenome TaxID=1070528 RepID=A0A8J9RR34_9ZZZZ
MEQKDNDKKPKKPQPTYADYLCWASLEGILEPISELQFEDLLKDIENDDFSSNSIHGLGLVPTLIGGVRPRPSINLNSRVNSRPGGASLPNLRGMPDVIATGMGVWDQISNPDSTTRSTVREVTQTMRGIRQRFEGMGGNVNVKGNPTVPGMPGGGGRGPRGALLFNIKPDPVEISYSPSIPNTVYADTFRQVKYRDANLYITSVAYQVPPNDQTVRDYVEKILIPNLELRANAATSFNTNAYINFTFEKVTSYIETVANALLVYFSLTNILSYCKNGGTNTGMFALKEMISAEDVLLLQTLGERLTNLPIPPRLKEQLYWLTDVSKSTNNVPNTPILLFTGMTFETTPEDAYDVRYFTEMTSRVQTYIDALNPPATSTTSFDMRMLDMMANVMPGWLKQGIGPGFGLPTHDGHWYDVWCNSPQLSKYGASGTLYTVPNVTDPMEDIPYVSVTNDMSGINQALFSVYYDYNWTGSIVPRISFIKDGSNNVVGFTNRLIFAQGKGTNNNVEGALYPYFDMVGSGNFEDTSYVLSQSGWFNQVDFSSNAPANHTAYFPSAVSQAVRGLNVISNQVPSYQSIQWIMSFDEAFSGVTKDPNPGPGKPKGPKISKKNKKKQPGKPKPKIMGKVKDKDQYKEEE